MPTACRKEQHSAVYVRIRAGDDSWGDDGDLSDSPPPVSEKKKDKEKNKEKGFELLEKETLTFSSPEIAEVCDRMHHVVEAKPGITADDFFTELRVLQVSQDFDAAVRDIVVDSKVNAQRKLVVLVFCAPPPVASRRSPRASFGFSRSAGCTWFYLLFSKRS